MDKINALELSLSYLNRVKDSNIKFTEAWLFGSYAKGNQHDDSDIDIAIVLDENIKNTFDTEVDLMVIRNGDETIIEPHVFVKNDFDKNIPIIREILKYGERLK